ncbi:MAG: ABC transporter permease [Lachnospiraceae bacterium]|jgi:ABC-type dipeptide/oligopeptide/nickel transport system permease component|nr:ABC transporter permease [Lachnospiraceae bacterium]MBR3509785.1 ABC transporter permease [Lachnospiraceae bacterium]
MKYLVKKIVTLIMTLFLVSVLAFLAFQIIPGDVVTSILGTEATPEREEALRKELGLDQPPVVRYVRWAGNVLKGDFGESYRYSKNMNQMMPVAELIGDKLPVTLLLAALSMLIIIVIAIPLGVFWARSKSKILDVSLNMGTQTAMAIPSFFLGVLVTYLFGFVLKWFAPGSYVSFRDDLWGCIRYLIFPAISVAIPKIAMTARFLRNSMLTERSSDYVRTAFSKGASERRVSYVHVLRNAMMPVVTFLGMIIAEIVAGSIVVEQVFSLPGIGKLLISSISTRDFPVVEILILYITFVVIFVYFLVDILYRVIDPRISSK